MRKLLIVIIAIMIASITFFYFDSKEKVVDIPLNSINTEIEIK